MVARITTHELAAMRANGEQALVLDVRPVAAFAAGQIPSARSLPADRLTAASLTSALGAASADDIVVIAGSNDLAAEQAARRTRCLGYTQVRVLQGAMGAWHHAGLPLDRTTPMPSAERQLLIVVGLLLSGVIAKALMLHPGFLAFLLVLAVLLLFEHRSPQPVLISLIRRLPWNRDLVARPAPPVV